MDLEEIKEKCSELNRQDCAIRNEMKELEKQRREVIKEQAKENIGRCFTINDNIYVKVINIPQEIWYRTGTNFNEYQYPALYIYSNQDIPFEIDNLFSGAWGVGNDPTKRRYKEITKEEFDQKFNEVLEGFKNKVEKLPFEIKRERAY